MSSKLIYQRQTKLIRVDAELHRLLKIKASKDSTTIRELLEGYIVEVLHQEN